MPLTFKTLLGVEVVFPASPLILFDTGVSQAGHRGRLRVAGVESYKMNTIMFAKL